MRRRSVYALMTLLLLTLCLVVVFVLLTTLSAYQIRVPAWGRIERRWYTYQETCRNGRRLESGFRSGRRQRMRQANLEKVYNGIFVGTRANEVRMITALITLDEPPSSIDFVGGAKRMLREYPALRQRLVFDQQHAYLQDMPDFQVESSIARYDATGAHVANIMCDPSVRTRADARAFLSRMNAQAVCEHRLPMWQYIVFPNYGTERQTGFICVLNHTLFDGISVIRFVVRCFSQNVHAPRVAASYDAFLQRFNKPSLAQALMAASLARISSPRPVAELDKCLAHIPAYHPSQFRRNSSHERHDERRSSSSGSGGHHTRRRHGGAYVNSASSERERGAGFGFRVSRRHWRDVFINSERTHGAPSYWWARDTLDLSALKESIRQLCARESLGVRVSINDVMLMCICEAIEDVARSHHVRMPLPLNVRIPLSIRSPADYAPDEDGRVQLGSLASIITMQFRERMSPSRKLAHIQSSMRADIWKPTVGVAAFRAIKAPMNMVQAFKRRHTPDSCTDALNLFISNVPGPQDAFDIFGASVSSLCFFTHAQGEFPLKYSIFTNDGRLTLALCSHPSFAVSLEEIGERTLEHLRAFI